MDSAERPVSPDSPTAPERVWWRRRKLIVALIGVVVALVAIKEGDVLFGENFHTVAAGELYRSAQLSRSNLERHVKTEGIRTVINLRGPNPGTGWYDDEIAACERLGVRHIDVRLSSREAPPPVEMNRLIAALHDAPRPILIHCKHGADRSGLGSAIYLITEHGMPTREAGPDQLCMWYGHVPFGATTAMDRFLESFAADGSRSLATWVAGPYAERFEAQAPFLPPSTPSSEVAKDPGQEGNPPP